MMTEELEQEFRDIVGKAWVAVEAQLTSQSLETPCRPKPSWTQVLGRVLYFLTMSDAVFDDELKLFKTWFRRRRLRWELFFLKTVAVDYAVLLNVGKGTTYNNIMDSFNEALKQELARLPKRYTETLLNRGLKYAQAVRQRDQKPAVGLEFARICLGRPDAVYAMKAEMSFHQAFELVTHTISETNRLRNQHTS